MSLKAKQSSKNQIKEKFRSSESVQEDVSRPSSSGTTRTVHIQLAPLSNWIKPQIITLLTESSFTTSWQTRERFPPLWAFTNNPPPPLIEFSSKLTLSSAKWSPLICLREHSVYHQFITLADSGGVFFSFFYRRMQHPMAGRRRRLVGEVGGRRWEPIVCERDMETHSRPISHAFSSADICWHFVSSYLFEHL